MTRINKHLKAETGFSLYEAYKKSLMEHPLHPGPKDDDMILPHTRLQQSSESSCTILDVFLENDQAPSLSQRAGGLSAIQTFKAIHNPPPGTSVQIVLWSIGLDFLEQSWEQVLGLGSKLDPRFLRSIRSQGFSLNFDSEATPKDLRARSIYLLGKGLDITTAPHKRTNSGAVVPVVLIAINLIDPRSEEIYECFGGVPPRNDAVHTSHQKEDSNASRLYSILLTIFMDRHRANVVDYNSFLIICVLPIVQLEILRTRQYLQIARNTFSAARWRRPEFPTKWEKDQQEMYNFRAALQAGAADQLYEIRTALRSLTEELENQGSLSSRFLYSQVKFEAAKCAPYLQHEEERICLVQEAHRLEEEIRDYLQLQTGQLALLESKKSIEFSNDQIQESKRGKGPPYLLAQGKLTNVLQLKYVGGYLTLVITNSADGR